MTVSPAPGVPGKLPFWKGDAVGRPVELGRALGAFVGELEADLARGARGRAAADARLRETHDLDELAASNLLAYLDDEREITGLLPTDKRIVVERFRDELGDWRLCILSPFGGRVHAPWSLALEARIGERLGLEVQTIWSDDGIAIRLPEGDAPLDGIEALLFPEADEVEDLVVGQLATSALFASRFRENAARALLLPRRRPGTRTPLWQQRQRSADLLAVASRYGSFPILVETYRECVSDVFDLPALREIMSGIASREIAIHSVETVRASPFAGSLMFDYVAAYMYDGDTPIAERRAGALTLDRDLLRELLGQEELRELLDPEALADLELSLQGLTDERKATSLDGVHDLLRRLGDLSTAEVAARTEGGPAAAGPWLAELDGAPARGPNAGRWRGSLAGGRRRSPLPRRGRHRAAGRDPGRIPRAGGRGARWAARALRPDARAVPDAGSSAALGSAGGCGRRCARAAARCRHPVAWRVPAGRRRARMVRPGGAPTAPATLPGAPPARGRAGRFGGTRAVPPGLAGRCPGRDRRCGTAAAARLGRSRAPGRGRRAAGRPGDPGVGPRAGRAARPVPGYQPRLLDELGALGEVAWVGRGSLGRDDGRIVLVRPGRGDPATDAGARRRRAALRAAPCRDPRPPRRARRVVLPRAVHGRPRDVRSPGPRCAVGPGLGRRGDERYVRPTSSPALEADWEWGPDGWRAAGPADHARTARGRRSLVPRAPPDTAARPTERLHAQSLALLERHGVVTREAVATEGIEGGFAAIYPILRAIEEAGRIRRGYFVDGLGAAQFALAGALDRLRATREPAEPASDGDVHLLAASDPAHRTAPRCRGHAAVTRIADRCSVPPAPTSSWSTGSRSCTSSEAARRSRPCPRPDDPELGGHRGTCLRCAGRGRTAPGAGHQEGRWPARRGVADSGRASMRRASCPATAASFRADRPVIDW